MRKVGVFAVLALSGFTPSCAERVMIPAATRNSAPLLEAAPKPQPKRNVAAKHQAEKVMEDARKRLASRARQTSPNRPSIGLYLTP